MKTRMTMFALIGFLSLFAFVQYGDASRIVMSLEEMAERSDAIAVGTVQNTWIDVRPFDDYHVIVDTAKVKVEQWLKNDKNAEMLEIRYYGYWAKMINDLRGISISDTPVHRYESGQKVLLILDHEEPTGVMGAGYYPLFRGSFVINDDVATSQTGEQSTLQQIYDAINNGMNDSQEQRLDNILESCEKFGSRLNDEKIQCK